jgi:hypothetical protein
MQTRLISLAALAAAIVAGACISGTEVPTASASNYKLTLDPTFKDSSLVPVGTAIPLRVHLSLNGAPVSGATVVWLVDSGGGRIGAKTTLTDSLGAASGVWVLGDTVRFNQMTVGSAGDSIVLHAHAIAGSPSALLRVTADSVGAAAGSTVTLGARVLDFFGNAAGGASITWTTTGGSIAPTTSTSTATGDVQAVLTTGKSPGTYVVTATLANQASVSFIVTTS